MRKKFFLTCFSILSISFLPFSLCSCGTKKETKAVIIDTNFSDDQAILSNNNCIKESDYSTFITLKTKNPFHNLACFVDNKPLKIFSDYTFFYSNDVIQLDVFAKANIGSNLTINIFFKNFDANFTLSNGAKLLSSKKVEYNEDYNCTISIDKGYKFKSIFLADKEKHFIENRDFVYELVEGENLIKVHVFSAAIVCPMLNINVCVLKSGFEIKWDVSGAPGVRFSASQTTAFLGEDFTTSFISNSDDAEITKVQVLNSSDQLIDGVDYVYETQDNYTFVYISGAAITTNEISINLTANVDLIHHPIDISCLKFHSYWDSVASKNIDVLDGLHKDSVINFNNSLRIPDFVEEIGDYAFDNNFNDEHNPNINELYFGRNINLRTINTYAFHGNKAFKKPVTFPNSLKKIGEFAFQNCENIPSITFPTNITTIDRSAFEGCTNLSGDLILPLNLEFIGRSAFAGCTGFSGTLKIYKHTELATLAFDGCSNFSVLDLTDFTHIPTWCDDSQRIWQFNDWNPLGGEVWVSFESDNWNKIYQTSLPKTWKIVVKKGANNE